MTDKGAHLESIVTIDGPAGSGKSSVAREVARRTGFTYVTTGAIYRAFALILDESGASFKDRHAVDAAAAKLASTYHQDSATGRVLLDGNEITAAIKAPRMSERASVVAEDAYVREVLLPIQRAVVRDCRGAVVDGRDMGTVVFPDAVLKIFLTASAAERAQRRIKELAAMGKSVDAAMLVAEIEARDARDMGRSVAPLKAAPDATVIDSTGIDFETVVQRILELCRQKKLTVLPPIHG